MAKTTMNQSFLYSITGSIRCKCLVVSGTASVSATYRVPPVASRALIFGVTVADQAISLRKVACLNPVSAPGGARNTYFVNDTAEKLIGIGKKHRPNSHRGCTCMVYAAGGSIKGFVYFIDTQPPQTVEKSAILIRNILVYSS